MYHGRISLSLGKDGMHSLASWKVEICCALKNQIGKYTANPGSVDLGRRATVFGGESAVNTGANLEVVREETEDQSIVPRVGPRLGPSMSTRSLGLNADVLQASALLARLATLNAAPPSAASPVTV
jgi:hypothetical protein